jgi:hypothetical protein
VTSGYAFLERQVDATQGLELGHPRSMIGPTMTGERFVLLEPGTTVVVDTEEGRQEGERPEAGQRGKPISIGGRATWFAECPSADGCHRTGSGPQHFGDTVPREL